MGTHSDPQHPKRASTHVIITLSVVVLSAGFSVAQTLHVPSGIPTQIKPTYTEPAVPVFNFGGGSTLGGNSGGTGNDGTGDGGTGGADNGGAALDLMNSQSWAPQATAAASAMGVNASALAATCVVESGCQNTGAGSGSSASGVWQMINSTYNADIAGAIAYNPSIAANVTSGLDGKMDPATEAYAAAYELRQDALILQKNDFSNPTVLDARTLYQFGQGDGVAVAKAQNSDNLASLLSLTPSQLAANGIASTTTVGEWRATITSKLGTTASQVVLAQK